MARTFLFWARGTWKRNQGAGTGVEEFSMEHEETGGVFDSVVPKPLDPKKPTLILIHGAASNGSFWEEQVGGLKDTVNTAPLDLPGHGRDQRPAKDSIRGCADAVLEFIDAVRPPGPLSLCGISMGGAIVLELLTGDRRELFASGVLINTGAKLAVDPAIFNLIERNYSDYIAMLRVFAVSKNADPEKTQTHIQEIAKCDPRVALGDFRACHAFDARDRLDRIEAPVLVLSAGDDTLTPPAYGKFLAQKIKDARLTHIPGAGHLSPIEKPGEVNAAIREFLRGAGR
jgi:pimeloyl-ACP methyl ester carboxylesterase